ncbi:hypothetical protein [Amycolatopsis jejuensis]|uniref:hypothetical protein n=1 Tax=Amycolatopsis jejuensis TaxID=330084 RepID=UPI000ACB96C4|nr:hypothetical protein [Amycolatopsis jejuensis]
MTGRLTGSNAVRSLLGAAVLVGMAACSTDGTALPVRAAAAQPHAGPGADTPGAAVEAWVTNILTERYKEACLASAPVSAPGKDPETECADPSRISAAKSLREAWAKPGVKLPPESKVEVTGVPADGDKVAVPDTAIKLDGRTLHSLELIGATGNTDGFSLKITAQKHDGKWYIGDMDINF